MCGDHRVLCFDFNIIHFEKNFSQSRFETNGSNFKQPLQWLKSILILSPLHEKPHNLDYSSRRKISARFSQFGKIATIVILILCANRNSFFCFTFLYKRGKLLVAEG